MKDFFQAIVFAGLFLIPFLPIYVENDFFFPYITGKNFAFRIIIEVVFASWVLLALYEPKYRPRFSWISVGFAAFLIVMFFANLFGEYPPKSFMSNFERMDGYITLVHVFMYLMVAGSVLTTKRIWSYFLHTSIAVALLVAVYGLAQQAGMVEGARARVDSRLGNAAYMAVYMLFHIFFLFYLFVQSKVNVHRVVYALITIILIYTLLLTGTRGTFMGLLGGSVVAIGYVTLFAVRLPQIRKFAVWGLVALVIAIGGFVSMKDSQYVEDSVALRRIASIDLSRDLDVRGRIWAMAWEGVKERPVLGWGQGNFNYVFNKNYDPELWNAESWFDRTHNIFFDWLIAGGILGLLTYLSIFVGTLYYLFWRPMRRRDERDPAFTVMERGVLIGLLAGYFAHNLVVFDNIISYIFFGSVLALIHSQTSDAWPQIENWKIDERLVNQFAAPIVILLLGSTVYFANFPGLGAAGDIIDAFKANNVEDRIDAFKVALARDSFADQEIVEQLVQNTISIVNNPNVSVEDKQKVLLYAEQEMQKVVDEKPGDARLHTFFATFYRTTGQFDKAREQSALARTFSPTKQAIIIEQGVIELQTNQVDAAESFFKEAFELDQDNVRARTLYATVLVAKGNLDEAKALITDEYMPSFATDDYALSVVDRSGDREFLMKMFEARVERRPGNAQNRASLAFLKYEAGEIEEAIAILKQAAEDVPEFAPTASCFVDNLEAGNKPDEGC